MWLAALVLLAALLAALYFHSSLPAVTRWRRQGVPCSWPFPLLGDVLARVLLQRSSMHAAILGHIRPHRERGYCGTFILNKPMLLVWEPEMAKQVLAKEFSSFHDRGVPFDESDPLGATLFNLQGERWRKLRNKLSPTFTSGKLKVMFPLMKDVTPRLKDAVLLEAKACGGSADMLSILGRFATDVIGTCAFGIECNSLLNKEDEFLSMAKEVSSKSLGQFVHMVLYMIHPALGRLLPKRFVLPKSRRFFLSVMKESVEHRERNKVVRNDFVQLLMQLKDSDRAEVNPENRIGFNNNLMTAQAFIFFVAGQENVAIIVSFCVHKLALLEDLQSRAAEEVLAVLAEHGGQLSYEAVQKMELVDRILKEGMRLWSPLGGVLRHCNSTTRVGEVVVEEGEGAMICTDAMHMDPDHFPDPTRFDPDRFTEEAEKARRPYAYLPFGAGPRICIAERFAIMEMKLALAFLLSELRFSPCARTELVPEVDTSNALLRPKHGFWVQVDTRA